MNRSEAARVLALPEDATSVAVTARYREMAKRTHPDVGGSAALWEQVEQAHRVLTNVRTVGRVADDDSSNLTRPRPVRCVPVALIVAVLMLGGTAWGTVLLADGSLPVAVAIAAGFVWLARSTVRGGRRSSPPVHPARSTAVVRR